MATTTQQRLPLAGVEAPGAWRLDEHTREVGRRGLAEARAALEAAARRADARDAADLETHRRAA